MPGLIGFTRKHLNDNKQCVETLLKQKALFNHESFYKEDSTYIDDNLCASRVTIGIINKEKQPLVKNQFFLWFDGETYCSENNFSSEEQFLNKYIKEQNFDFLSTYDGIFSAVLYDSEQKLIYLIPDRYGLRPLYWTIFNKNFYWFSEIKAIREIPDFSVKINKDAIHNYLIHGYFIGNETCFENIGLLPYGTVLKWDIDKSTIDYIKYWDYSFIKRESKILSINDTIEEIGHLLLNAVEKRCSESEKIGITLSGGLDSRAMLACAMRNNSNLNVYTFGKKNCEDILVAKKVTKKFKINHEIIDINSDNWFLPRIKGIWLTDGQKNLIHMHGFEGILKMKQHSDFIIDGFLGDVVLGGSYLTKTGKENEFHLIQNRGRRLIMMGCVLWKNYFETRIPFFDYKLFDLVYSLPAELRLNSYIYKKVLLSLFPEYYKNIRWNKTGVSIDKNQGIENLSYIIRLYESALFKRLSLIGLFPYGSRIAYTNYGLWLYKDPAYSFIMNCINDKNSIINSIVDTNSYNIKLFENKLKTKPETILAYITLETYFQQFFNRKHLNFI